MEIVALAVPAIVLVVVAIIGWRWGNDTHEETSEITADHSAADSVRPAHERRSKGHRADVHAALVRSGQSRSRKHSDDVNKQPDVAPSDVRLLTAAVVAAALSLIAVIASAFVTSS